MATMYADMQPQEELANLFARNLTLTQPAPAPIPAPAPAPVEETPAQPAPAKIVYISQHYNHSAHLARQNAQQQQQQSPPPRPASEPPQNEHAEVERVLRNYSVDPSGLSSAQLQLFRTVDDPQRLRLIELWRACPPKNGSDNPTLVWGVTTVDQEETLARMRYEQQQQIQQQLEEEQMQMEMQMQLEQEQQQHFQRQQASQQQQQQREFAMSLDGTPVTPTQTNDGRWVPTADDFQYMEEYMLAGYGDEICRREFELSARKAIAESLLPAAKEVVPFGSAASAGGGGTTAFSGSRHADPVYKTMNAGVNWKQEIMADQYGRLMAMREDEEML